MDYYRADAASKLLGVSIAVLTRHVRFGQFEPDGIIIDHSGKELPLFSEQRLAEFVYSKAPSRATPAIDRIAAMTEYVGDHWLCTMSPMPNGYCHTTVTDDDGTHHEYVHRIAYEYFFSMKGVQWVGHDERVCKHPNCWNPDHLVGGSPGHVLKYHADQVSTINARKTHCDPGHHPFSGYNLVIDSLGRRKCRECLNRMQREHYANKKNKEND